MRVSSISILELLCIILISKQACGLSVPEQAFNELERLIKGYKDSTNLVHHQSEDTTDLIPKQKVNVAELKILARAHARPCGIASRLAYETCVTKASNSNEQRLCAKLFSKRYSKCYFGNTHHKQKSFHNLMKCTVSCTWKFDSCLINSNKVEMFICMSGRNNCYKHCPWNTAEGHVLNFNKRETNCHSNCEGEFDLCFNVVKKPSELFVCNVNRNDCKAVC